MSGKFHLRSDPAAVFRRGMVASRFRRDEASLRRRADGGDPNVVAHLDKDGSPERYAVEFTESQRSELAATLLAALPTRAGPTSPMVVHEEVEIFVRVLETWGDALLDEAPMLDQKARKRAIASFISAFERVDQSLDGMDLHVLGWLYGNVADDFASAGSQLSPTDHDRVTNLDDGHMAQIEGAELRQELRWMAGVITTAAKRASETLPVPPGGDARLNELVRGIRAQFDDLGIPFTSSESGAAAQCLRAVLELGGRPIDRVTYWLKKAET